MLGAAVSSTQAWDTAVLLLPAASVSRTLSVLLDVCVWPDSDQVFEPTDVVAVVQVEPLSSETSTISPETMLAEVVPLMVWAAVLVMKSVLLVPVSAENAIVAMVVVGATLSTVALEVSAVVVVLPALTVAVPETIR